MKTDLFSFLASFALEKCKNVVQSQWAPHYFLLPFIGYVNAGQQNFLNAILIILQYKNSMDRGARWAIVHRVAKSQTWLSTVQFNSVTQLCPTLCNPMDCSIPGLPVHHQVQEFAHTHVHRVGDAIQPSHPLSSPSPPPFSLAQHQGLFQWVSSSNQVAKILEFQLQHQSFQQKTLMTFQPVRDGNPFSQFLH